MTHEVLQKILVNFNGCIYRRKANIKVILINMVSKPVVYP